MRRPTIDLSRFQLTSTTDGAPPSSDADWIDALVPGGVHESLIAAGRLAHPYVGDNESTARWVEDVTWWYRSSFDLTPAELARGGVTLRFGCLDTVADAYLNGTELGHTRNQHRPHEYDVSGLLRSHNELLVRFPPALVGLLDEEEAEEAIATVRKRQQAIRPGAAELPREALLLPSQRSRLRKATFSWGWDFAARVPSIGIAGPVTVEWRTNAPSVSDWYAWTTRIDLERRTATVAFRGTLDGAAEDGDLVRVELRSPSGRRHTTELPLSGELSGTLDLDEVETWWTHDLGPQPLYEVTVSVHRGPTVLSSLEQRIGIRTIELDRSPDEIEDARHFRFRLNGQPVFARGANWVPPSLLVGSVPPETRRRLVQLARDGGMTMLRVWGGGVYEPDHFYDACDELGVLVWQDFMFACFDYPDPTGALAAETRLEAIHQVTRLRHHPCLALWCGNNEVQIIHEFTHGNVEPGDWGWSLWHEVLPEVVAGLDPARPYWPGSPWGEDASEVRNGIRDGDRHAWEVWHGLDVGAGGPTEFDSRGEAVHFGRYSHDRGRFISEFGIHACPELATLRRWTEPGTLSWGGAALDQRNKDTPKDKGFALMERETGIPSSLDEYVDFTMACQAEGLKHGVEHYRRRQPHCNGTLVWQLNDSWPGLSWSVIDYDLVPKAGYYFLQRAYGPLLAGFHVGPDGLALWLTNSGCEDAEVDLVVEVVGFDGRLAHRAELSATAAAYSSQPVWDHPHAPPANELAWVSSPSGALPSNRRFFGALKELPLDTATPVEARITARSENRATVELSASQYSYLTRVMSSDPGAAFSSNYLDLRPGDTHTVEVTGLREGSRLSVGSYRGAVRELR